MGGSNRFLSAVLFDCFYIYLAFLFSRKSRKHDDASTAAANATLSTLPWTLEEDLAIIHAKNNFESNWDIVADIVNSLPFSIKRHRTKKHCQDRWRLVLQEKESLFMNSISQASTLGDTPSCIGTVQPTTPDGQCIVSKDETSLCATVNAPSPTDFGGVNHPELNVHNNITVTTTTTTTTNNNNNNISNNNNNNNSNDSSCSNSFTTSVGGGRCISPFSLHNGHSNPRFSILDIVKQAMQKKKQIPGRVGTAAQSDQPVTTHPSHFQAAIVAGGVSQGKEPRNPLEVFALAQQQRKEALVSSRIELAIPT